MQFRTALFVFTVAALSTTGAHATKPFHLVFIDAYVEGHENEEFVKQATDKRYGCLVCHQGKKKKNHNNYGKHLVELLDKKKDAKDKEKILAALEKVAKLHSDPEDESSPTFGELIQAGKLPGGDMETVKKEPEAEEGEKEEAAE